MEHVGRILNKFGHGYQCHIALYLLCLTIAEGGGEGGGERRPVDLLASPQVKRLIDSVEVL